MSEIMYSGQRTKKGVVVRVGRRKLPMRRDVVDHSTEFEWGYSGAGPAQLAFAILADYIGDDDIAKAIYQDFKFVFVSMLDRDSPWTLTAEQLNDLLKPILKDKLKRWTAWTFNDVISVAEADKAPGPHVVAPLWTGEAVDYEHAIKKASSIVKFDVDTMKMMS